eukprot:TRINITY_DN4124_c0_g3_i2.p1 TRINITY_DN4124_c0_g3~~TRINITY_DN4124_c0_g3_i2.p1  ORF type:complete len:711 (-),score=220.64 TRINITY_DN4124_c0_g3_i2:50-2182(-)
MLPVFKKKDHQTGYMDTVTHFIAIQKDVTLVKQGKKDIQNWNTAEVAFFLECLQLPDQFIQAVFLLDLNGEQLLELDASRLTKLEEQVIHDAKNSPTANHASIALSPTHKELLLRNVQELRLNRNLAFQHIVSAKMKDVNSVLSEATQYEGPTDDINISYPRNAFLWDTGDHEDGVICVKCKYPDSKKQSGSGIVGKETRTENSSMSELSSINSIGSISSHAIKFPVNSVLFLIPISTTFAEFKEKIAQQTHLADFAVFYTNSDGTILDINGDDTFLLCKNRSKSTTLEVTLINMDRALFETEQGAISPAPVHNQPFAFTPLSPSPTLTSLCSPREDDNLSNPDFYAANPYKNNISSLASMDFTSGMIESEQARSRNDDNDSSGSLTSISYNQSYSDPAVTSASSSFVSLLKSAEAMEERDGFEMALISDPDAVLLALSHYKDPEDQRLIAKNVIQILHIHDECPRLIKRAIKKEVALTASLNVIFRETTITTQLLIEYMNMKSTSYLKKAIQPIVKQIVKENMDFEVNPDKVEERKAKKNQKLLIQKSTQLLEEILNSIPFFPSTLKKIFSFMQTRIREKFPQADFKMVASFFFLRLICPAIISPHHYNLLSEKVPSKAQRSLIYISKVIQNTANNIHFNEKHMVGCNDFIDQYQIPLSIFFSKLTNHVHNLHAKNECLDILMKKFSLHAKLKEEKATYQAALSNFTQS